MEVESVPYIFGSFSRRKPSHTHSHSDPSTGNFDSRKLPDQPEVPETTIVRARHAHSKSQPDTGNGAANSKQDNNRALRTRSLNLKTRSDNALLSATCPVCNHVFLEPRVLECLHSFCTRCLQDIMEKYRERGEVWLPRDETSKTNSGTDSVISPAQDINIIGVDANYITCPVCGERTPLCRRGVLGLPPDYVIQHRLVLATLNDENTKLLCDLCTGDVVAMERCSQCLVNVCAVCAAMHRRHAHTAQHELLRLRDVRRQGLMRIHRHLMCHAHPEHELRVYCTTCEQPACPICISQHHAGHRYSACAPAAASGSQRVRRLMGRARAAASRDLALRRRLTAARRHVHRRCSAVAGEVERYMEEYRRVVEMQREKLLGEIENIRSSLLTHLSSFESSLSSRLQSSSTTINFSQALLEEGSDVEFLIFVSTLLKKLEDLEQPVKIAEEMKELLKQTAKDRSSDHDGLVDFILENDVKNGEMENCGRNFDAFQRPIRHVLVDFVPKEELHIEKKNCIMKEDNLKLTNKDSPFRKSDSPSNSLRNSKNIQDNSNNRKCNSMNIVIEENEVKSSSLKRKSNIEEITSKPITGLLNHLKNCLENHEDKKTHNKSSKFEDNNLHHKIENLNKLSNTDNVITDLHKNSVINESSEETGILEFLPLEPEIYTEGLIPVVFGQIRRLTSTSSSTSQEVNNCCSASRPHLGRNPNQKNKNCCGLSIDKKEQNQLKNRKSDAIGSVYQITI